MEEALGWHGAVSPSIPPCWEAACAIAVRPARQG